MTGGFFDPDGVAVTVILRPAVTPPGSVECGLNSGGIAALNLRLMAAIPSG